MQNITKAGRSVIFQSFWALVFRDEDKMSLVYTAGEISYLRIPRTVARILSFTTNQILLLNVARIPSSPGTLRGCIWFIAATTFSLIKGCESLTAGSLLTLDLIASITSSTLSCGSEKEIP